MNSQFHLRRGLLLVASMVASLAVGVYLERTGILYGLVPGSDSYQAFNSLVEIYYQVRTNYVEPIDRNKLINGAIDGMLAKLDPYSNYFTADELKTFDKATTGKFSGIGAEFSQDPNTGAFIVVSPLEDSPALKAGLLAGDRVLKLNGESLDGLNLRDFTLKVSGLPNTDLTLSVLHEGDDTPVDLTIKRAVVTVHSVKGYKLANGDGKWDFLISPQHRIAYVRLTNFTDTTAEDLDHALLPLINSPDSLHGIILDLRFNPGGLLSAGIDVADRFLDSGIIVSTRGRDGKDQEVATAKKEGTYPPIPLVVLINEFSASASEIVAGALRDHHRAVLIGTRTFGKGSVQHLITLGNGESALKLTTAYYYLPSGQNIARKKDAKTWGVEPDPNFLVPFSKTENIALLRSRHDSEIIHPSHPTTTAPATQLAATQEAATQEAFVDLQLQRALDALIAHQILSGDKLAADVTTTRPAATASLPATAPSSEPRP